MTKYLFISALPKITVMKKFHLTAYLYITGSFMHQLNQLTHRKSS